MSQGREFRGDRSGRKRAFDWYAMARERGLSYDQALRLYGEAQLEASRHRDPERVLRSVYIAQLDRVRPKHRIGPGKITRIMLEEAGLSWPLPASNPGTVATTSYLLPHRSSAANGSPDQRQADARQPSTQRAAPYAVGEANEADTLDLADALKELSDQSDRVSELTPEELAALSNRGGLTAFDDDVDALLRTARADEGAAAAATPQLSGELQQLCAPTQPALKTAWEWTNDPWMDAAHRGTVPTDLAQTPHRDTPIVQRSPAATAGGNTHEEVSNVSTPLPGVTYEGKVVGTWDAVFDSQIKAARRVGPGFESKEAAIAYGKTLSKGAVIIRHQAWYVVQEIDDGSMWDFDRDNIKQMHGSKHIWSNITKAGSEVPGVVAFVTEDGYPIEAAVAPNDRSQADRYHQRIDSLSGPAKYRHRFVEAPDKKVQDPLSPFRAAAGPGMRDLDDDQFVHGFYNAMRDLALDNLDKSEAKVEAERQKLHGQSLPPGDKKTIRQVAKQIAEKDKSISKLRWERAGLMLQLSQISGFNGRLMDAVLDNIERNRTELAKRELERKLVLLKYPLLARVDAEEFSQRDEGSQTEMLRDEVGEILEDIAETRENILNGDLDLWEISPIVQATITGLGVENQQHLRSIEGKARSARNSKLILNVALAVFQVGLGIAAIFASGGLALGLAAGAVALGAGDAAYQTDQFLTRSAAANTALDPNQSILNPAELGMDGFWLVVAWVSVGLDVGAAVKAVRGLKAGKAAAEVLTEAGDPRLTEEMVQAGAKQLDAPAAKTGQGASNVPSIRGVSGFKVGISADEIVEINRRFSDGITMTGDVTTVLTNAERHTGFFNKSASIIRDIAGRHLFSNGNKRTTHAVITELINRNNIFSGPSSEELYRVISRVARGELREVSEIASVLRGY